MPINGFESLELVRDHLAALRRERESFGRAGALHKPEKIDAAIALFEAEFSRMEGELKEKIKRENEARLAAAGLGP